MSHYDPESILKPSRRGVVEDASSIVRPMNSDSTTRELSGYLYGIASGDLVSANFTDWPVLSTKTQWGVPGTITMVVGDPGVGKTFWVLQALRGWVRQGVNCAVLFVEKDRKFHTQRLLAQLEENGQMLDWEWLRKNGKLAQDAIDRHHAELNELGHQIWSRPMSELTLGAVGAWIRDRADEGARVIVIDPITAADAGDTRWRADKDFVLGVQRVLGDSGASLILVNHPKQTAGREKNPSGHSQAGSAAFFNFSDTDIWIRRLKTVKRVELMRTREDVPWRDSLDTFVHIHKARFGRGTRDEIGLRWEKMHFAEQGIVIRDVKDDSSDDVIQLQETIV